MRRALVICLLTLGVAADDREEILRAAVDAKLQLGDLLRKQGDLGGALKAYKEAAELWERRKTSTFVEAPPGKKGPNVGDGPWIKGKDRKWPRYRDRANSHRQLPRPTLSAVELGLKWLADHQDISRDFRWLDGRWDSDDFAKHDPADDKTTGKGHPLFDVGATGLSVLAFLGAGYTDRGSVRENKYAKNVRNGLRFLMTRQDTEGCFGRRQSQHFIYNHAIATLAMCEAYWMTRNPRYKRPAMMGIQFIEASRNPGAAWRYGARPGDNDTSVTAWCVAALHAGKYGGIEVDAEAFKGALAWLDKVTDPHTGTAGYTQQGGVMSRPPAIAKAFPADKSRSMTAAAVLTRMLCGQAPARHPVIRRGARQCIERLPKWNTEDGSIDMYYWYFGSLAMRQMGDKLWRKWR